MHPLLWLIIGIILAIWGFAWTQRRDSRLREFVGLLLVLAGWTIALEAADLFESSTRMFILSLVLFFTGLTMALNSRPKEGRVRWPGSFIGVIATLVGGFAAGATLFSFMPEDFPGSREIEIVASRAYNDSFNTLEQLWPKAKEGFRYIRDLDFPDLPDTSDQRNNRDGQNQNNGR